MALPKLDSPVYELEQPSTGEKIKYLFCKTQMGEILKEDAKLGKSQTL